jgi:2,4-dienoyl-CoA reductase-like NADH-dependent reductase (Old Yellow Enzyme family)
MAKIMLFKRGLHAKELDMRYLESPEQQNQIEKFKAAGYYENPPTVCMYNPETKEQLIIHSEDQAILESRGFFANPAWVYHPTEGKKLVPNAEISRFLQDGWYDTPAKFPGNYMGVNKVKTTLGITKGNAA